MQKLLLFLCLSLIQISVFAQKTNTGSATRHAAVKSNDHSNALKIGLNTFFDTDEFPFYINWETKVGPSESIQLGILPRFKKYNDEKTSGTGVSASYRRYISKNRSGIQGLFISPVVKAGFLSDDNTYTSYYYTGNPPQPQYYSYSSQRKINQYNIALVFGHKWAYRSGFTFETSGGFGYYHTKEHYTSNNTSLGSGSVYTNNYTYSGILPQLQINFGYAF
jgi:hypothetical protein